MSVRLLEAPEQPTPLGASSKLNARHACLERKAIGALRALAGRNFDQIGSTPRSIW